MSDIGMRRTFGVLDRTDLDDLHVVSIKGGDPLIDLPESEVTAWAAGTFALGDQRSYAPTHGVYTCIKARLTPAPFCRRRSFSWSAAFFLNQRCIWRH